MARYSVRLRHSTIQDICVELGISRPTLARLLEVSYSTVMRAERNETAPSNAMIGGLIQVSGYAFDELFIVDESPSPLPPVLRGLVRPPTLRRMQRMAGRDALRRGTIDDAFGGDGE